MLTRLLPNEGGRFALRFAVFAGLLFAVYTYPHAEQSSLNRLFQSYLAGYARLAGFVIGLLEPGIRVSGSEILGRFPLRIVATCDAMEVNLTFAAAMLALPGPIGRRLLALAAGVALIACANVLRIVSLYYIGVHARPWFEFAHLELFPLLLVLGTALFFLAASRRLVPPAITPAASAR